MDKVMAILWYDLLPLLCKFGRTAIDVISLSARDVLTVFLDLSFGLDLTLPDWAWLDHSVLSLMLGTGFIVFICVTMIKWLLDIVF